MNSSNHLKLGILFRREHPTELLPGFAQNAEEVGFDEIWVVEDCFYSSGIASAASALASTNHIKVGVGILPVVVRNPVFTAMELATLARLYPGRILPGLGHGVASWMKQIGALPDSQLTALEEVTVAVKDLLKGNSLDFDGKYIHLKESALVFPPEEIPPISLSVRGPKSLALSGKIADGTILAELAAPAYVSWAETEIMNGQLPGQARPHRLTVFVFACTAPSKDAAIEIARSHFAPIIASGKIDAQLAPLGIMPQVKELREAFDQDQFADAIPSAWIKELALLGTSDDWQATIHRFADAGVDSLILVPLPGEELGELFTFRKQLKLG